MKFIFRPTWVHDRTSETMSGFTLLTTELIKQSFFKQMRDSLFADLRQQEKICPVFSQPMVGARLKMSSCTRKNLENWFTTDFIMFMLYQRMQCM